MKKREMLIAVRERQLLFDALLQQVLSAAAALGFSGGFKTSLTTQVTTIINNLRTLEGMINTAVGVAYTQVTYNPDVAFMAPKYVPQFDAREPLVSRYGHRILPDLVTLMESEATELFFVDDEGPSDVGNDQYVKDDIVYPDPAAAVIWSDTEEEIIETIGDIITDILEE